MSRQSTELRRLAREQFGWPELRPGQLEAVEAVVAGRDTLAVMATGYGKSAIYQLAAQMLAGATIVVSPLIALQREQVEDLQHEELGGAAAVSSAVGARARREALAGVRDQRLEYLFLAPEQFSNPKVLEDLRAAEPSLLVVDEAHCISEWGHDFRPDYLRLGAVAEAIGRPTILALTATASAPVREEIVERLHMREPLVLVRGFNRDNIRLGVEHFHEAAHKRRAFLERTAAADKPGIVYAATRRGAEELARELSGHGVAARAYHGGMATRERNAIQEAFMDDGFEVIVATTAFGMGVDKPNVRFVFHYEIADSVDSYYQEVGRAGRDGEPARATLFYRPEDLGVRRFFAGSGLVDAADIERVAEAIDAQGGQADPAILCEDLDLSQSKLTTAIGRLEDVGAVEVMADGHVEARPGLRRDLRALVHHAAGDQADREQFDRSRIEMIQGYAELYDDCRREYLLNYFGEDFRAPCGRCDNCEAGRVQADGPQPFPNGVRVSHVEWGEGVVQRQDDGSIVVLFETVGYKTLGVDLVARRNLLARVT